MLATIQSRTFCLLSKNIKITIHTNCIIFLAVLYGCKTWSLPLQEKHRLRVFENRMLKRIFGPKRDEVTGDWRKLHNEELHNLYSSQNVIKMMKYTPYPRKNSRQICFILKTAYVPY
jgi:hypothetical protein